MILEEMVFWHWWVLAFGFLVLEMIATAYFFLWLGAAAGVIGMVMLIMPELSWEAQWGVWALLSAVSVTVSYFLRKKNAPPKEDEDLVLNQRGQQYVGRSFTLEHPVVNGQGKIKVDDSTWKVEADMDIGKGEKIKVTAVDGTVLIVEKAA
jgi:membrane protein implicated in regulation of membrane protease activity